MFLQPLGLWAWRTERGRGPRPGRPHLRLPSPLLLLELGMLLLYLGLQELLLFLRVIFCVLHTGREMVLEHGASEHVRALCDCEALGAGWMPFLRFI
eukprot:60542-Pelagomonas_calceolata.AAC.1